MDVGELERTRAAAADALREAAAAVESGAGGVAERLAAVTAWDRAIAKAAASLKLPGNDVTLKQVATAAAQREEERRAAERAALDERIDVIKKWLDGGGPGATEAKAFLEQLTRLRDSS